LIYGVRFNAALYLTIIRKYSLKPNTNPSPYLLAGPNGAGKTTCALSIMPEALGCLEYVNADAFAAGLSPFRPQAVSIDAGRIMLKRINTLAEMRVDFAFETTLASRSIAPFIQGCKEKGYTFNLIYIWLKSVELAVERVR